MTGQRMEGAISTGDPTARRGKPIVPNGRTSARRRRAVDRRIGILMATEAVTFAVAAFLHLDGHIPLGFTVVTGESVPRAAIPEAILGSVLAIGSLAALAMPARAWPLALGTTGFATFGTVVGLAAVVSGVGPRTVPDLVYHASILTVLLVSLAILLRQRVHPSAE
jgi:hypothetical protein